MQREGLLANALGVRRSCIRARSIVARAPQGQAQQREPRLRRASLLGGLFVGPFSRIVVAAQPVQLGTLVEGHAQSGLDDRFGQQRQARCTSAIADVQSPASCMISERWTMH
jgi:hypothetical protein